MVKAYVYKDSSGDYRVYPAVVVVAGGQKFRFVNASTTKVKVTLPAGASDEDDPVTETIEPGEREDFTTRDQGNKKAKAYKYTVALSRRRRARGNSDPILIIEN